MIHVGDNTWNLRVMITDLQVEKTLRVKGDLHIGGVMLKLSKTEGELTLGSLISAGPFPEKRRVARTFSSFISMNQILLKKTFRGEKSAKKKKKKFKIHNLLKITLKVTCVLVGCLLGWLSQYVSLSSLRVNEQKKNI